MKDLVNILIMIVPLVWLVLLIGVQIANIFEKVEYEAYVRLMLFAIAIGLWWFILEYMRRDV